MAAALADRSPLITLSARSDLSRFNRLRSEMVDSRLDGRKESLGGGRVWSPDANKESRLSYYPDTNLT